MCSPVGGDRDDGFRLRDFGRQSLLGLHRLGELLAGGIQIGSRISDLLHRSSRRVLRLLQVCLGLGSQGIKLRLRVGDALLYLLQLALHMIARRGGGRDGGLQIVRLLLEHPILLVSLVASCSRIIELLLRVGDLGLDVAESPRRLLQLVELAGNALADHLGLPELCRRGAPIIGPGPELVSGYSPADQGDHGDSREQAGP